VGPPREAVSISQTLRQAELAILGQSPESPKLPYPKVSSHTLPLSPPAVCMIGQIV